MSRRDDHPSEGHEMSPHEQRALETLRSLPAPEPSDAARARAWSAFAGSGGASRRSPAPRRGSQFGYRLLTFAAVVTIVLIALNSMSTMSWFVTDVVGTATVDEVTVTKGLEVNPGAITTEAESELELQLGEEIRIRCMPNTRAQLPSAPGRWFQRDRSLVVTEGEIYGTTDGALDFTFRLQTPEAVATLTGTTFAVFRTPDATCFCLFDGALDVAIEGGATDVGVPVGQRIFIYKDGRPHLIEPITDMEAMKLGMMKDGGILTENP